MKGTEQSSRSLGSQLGPLPMGAALSLCLPSRGAAWAHRGCPRGEEVRIECAGGEGSESGEDREMEGEEGWMKEGI